MLGCQNKSAQILICSSIHSLKVRFMYDDKESDKCEIGTFYALRKFKPLFVIFISIDSVLDRVQCIFIKLLFRITSNHESIARFDARIVGCFDVHNTIQKSLRITHWFLSIRIGSKNKDYLKSTRNKQITLHLNFLC